MTVTYQSQVSTASFCGLTKFLLVWRGSVYKIVYREFLVYATAYIVVSAVYRNVLTGQYKSEFEKLCLYCGRYLDLIPLSFVLGFYVTFVVQRWWQQFTTIPWPDRLMNTIILYVDGADDGGRLIRRTLMRYMNLSLVLLLRSVSMAVKKRFPTENHLIEAGFTTDDELRLIGEIKAKINKFWVPMCWFLRLLHRAKAEGRVREGAALKHILEEMNEFRNRLMLLWCHDWVSVPLVYTQVVTWAVHLFFVFSILGRQFLDPSKNYPNHDMDFYVPFFLVIQFFFYMGWLKVAEQLLSPFGEDDDDIECNWLIDRHIQVSYLGVDELYTKLPKIERDLYWNQTQANVPYTSDTVNNRKPTYRGSAVQNTAPDRDQVILFSPGMDHTPRKNSVFDKLKPQRPTPEKKWNLWRRVVCQNSAGSDDAIRSISSHVSNGSSSSKTLGSRETLLPDDILAALNAGSQSATFSSFGLAETTPAEYALTVEPMARLYHSVIAENSDAQPGEDSPPNSFASSQTDQADYERQEERNFRNRQDSRNSSNPEKYTPLNVSI